MNVIDLLKKQHTNLREALEELVRADSIDPMELRLVADELVAHMVIEEHVLYPRIRELTEDKIRESFEEHAVARFELARVLIARGDEQKSRLHVLKELIDNHLREEETSVLPRVERAIRRDELEALGERMEPMFEKAVELGFERLVVSNGQGPQLRGEELGAGRGRQKQAGAQEGRRRGEPRGQAGQQGSRARRGEAPSSRPRGAQSKGGARTSAQSKGGARTSAR